MASVYGSQARGGACAAADKMVGWMPLALLEVAAGAQAAAWNALVADGESRATADEPLRRARHSAFV
jgi:hypothetical protein